MCLEKKTPRSDGNAVTNFEAFLSNTYEKKYYGRHVLISNSDESIFLNEFKPEFCPFCNSKKW